MQLSPPARGGSLRVRLAAAALALLAGGPAPTHAATTDDPRWLLEASGLYYAESQRVTVMEPVAKLTRLFDGGRTLSLQVGLDAVTGATPTGGVPSEQVQTVTSPSGTTSSSSASQVPTVAFHDYRGLIDLSTVQPLGALLTTTGGHFSREKDYMSLGVNERWSFDVMQRLATITVGGSLDRDEVFPVHGTPAPLTDGSVIISTAHQPKDVNTLLAGLSRILTRRLLVGVTMSWTRESGYLTDPYKRMSVVDPVSGAPVSVLTERRPDQRQRTDVLVSAVDHLDGEDVAYVTYREYWDDWGVRSHTLDLKYHRDLPERDYLVPHVRLYLQEPADFYRWGIIQGEALPVYASSDQRLGALRTLTLGATYGFHISDDPGEATVRAEYLVQWGDGFPADAVGALKDYNLAPAVGTFTLTAGYTLRF